MARAQAAMEYIVVIGFAMVLAFPLIIIFFTQSQDVTDQLTMNQVREIGRKLISTAESVYYLGEPSQTTLKVYMPSGVENIVIDPDTNELIFNVTIENMYSDVVFKSDIPINGDLDPISGVRYIIVKNVQHTVVFSDGD